MSLAGRHLCHKLAAEYGTGGRLGWQSATADPDAGEPAMEEICPKPYKRKKQKGKKEQDLSAYPVTETIHYTFEGEGGACLECGTPMKEVTTESTKTLKFVPAHFEVLEEIVHVYSCPKYSAMERAQKPVPFLTTIWLM